MSAQGLSPHLLAGLRALAEGRTPTDEALIAKLRRKGLVSRSVFDRHAYFLTDEGRRVLGAAS